MNKGTSWSTNELKRHVDSVFDDVKKNGRAFIDYRGGDFVIIKQEYYDMLEGVDNKSAVMDRLHESICIERTEGGNNQKHIFFVDDDTLNIFSKIDLGHDVIYRERQYSMAKVKVSSKRIDLPDRPEYDSMISKAGLDDWWGGQIDTMSQTKTVDTIEAFIRFSNFEKYDPVKLKISLFEEIQF